MSSTQKKCPGAEAWGGAASGHLRVPQRGAPYTEAIFRPQPLSSQKLQRMFSLPFRSERSPKHPPYDRGQDTVAPKGYCIRDV